MLWMLRSTSSMVLAPVQTILPLEKIRAEVLGSFMRKTRVGNCSGLYSVLGRVVRHLFQRNVFFQAAGDNDIYNSYFLFRTFFAILFFAI